MSENPFLTIPSMFFLSISLGVVLGTIIGFGLGRKEGLEE